LTASTPLIRRQHAGAQNRRVARERARALAADGQLELKLLVRVADCEPLNLTGDLSDDDLTTGGRLSAALAELLPDMVRTYAGRLETGQLELRFLVAVAALDPLVQTGDLSEDDLTTGGRASPAVAELFPNMVRTYAGRLEDPKPGSRDDYAFTLPGSRTHLGEATPADLELAKNNLRDEALERAGWRRWFELIARALPPGKDRAGALTLDQLRVLCKTLHSATQASGDYRKVSVAAA
jgi:hypothetical protein